VSRTSLNIHFIIFKVNQTSCRFSLSLSKAKVKVKGTRRIRPPPHSLTWRPLLALVLPGHSRYASFYLDDVASVSRRTAPRSWRTAPTQPPRHCYASSDPKRSSTTTPLSQS
jgi:hypothetical protein